MNQILLLLSVCLLAGCGALKPVEGAPEIQIRAPDTATITIQENGSRLVVVNRGENVVAVILLPPAKVAVEAPVESPKNK